MAELIKKNELIEALAISRHHHASSSRENELLYRAENIVREQPTTTEAEIIEKFAEKLGEAFSENSSEIKVDGMTFDILTLDGVIEIMWDLVEQLSEE